MVIAMVRQLSIIHDVARPLCIHGQRIYDPEYAEIHNVNEEEESTRNLYYGLETIPLEPRNLTNISSVIFMTMTIFMFFAAAGIDFSRIPGPKKIPQDYYDQISSMENAYRIGNASDVLCLSRNLLPQTNYTQNIATLHLLRCHVASLKFVQQKLALSQPSIDSSNSWSDIAKFACSSSIHHGDEQIKINAFEKRGDVNALDLAYEQAILDYSIALEIAHSLNKNNATILQLVSKLHWVHWMNDLIRFPNSNLIEERASQIIGEMKDHPSSLASKLLRHAESWIKLSKTVKEYEKWHTLYHQMFVEFYDELLQNSVEIWEHLDALKTVKN